MAGEHSGFLSGGQEALHPMQAPLSSVLQKLLPAPGVCTEGARTGPRHSHTLLVQQVLPVISPSRQDAAYLREQEIEQPAQIEFPSMRHVLADAAVALRYSSSIAVMTKNPRMT
jgi:hypothetical protein